MKQKRQSAVGMVRRWMKLDRLISQGDMETLAELARKLGVDLRTLKRDKNAFAKLGWKIEKDKPKYWDPVRRAFDGKWRYADGKMPMFTENKRKIDRDRRLHGQKIDGE